MDARRPDMLSQGTTVRVRSRFDGSWVAGFEIIGTDSRDDGAVGYRVRRITDGAELPTAFDEHEVTPAAPATYGGSFWPGLP